MKSGKKPRATEGRVTLPPAIGQLIQQQSRSSMDDVSPDVRCRGVMLICEAFGWCMRGQGLQEEEDTEVTGGRSERWIAIRGGPPN